MDPALLKKHEIHGVKKKITAINLGSSELVEAINNLYAKKVIKILQSGVSPNFQLNLKRFRYPIDEAVKKGSIEMVQIL